MPRFLYFDIDMLRPDHMGCYGYKMNTTPNLDKIAAAGIIFENYFCSDVPCLPSRNALISGMFGINTAAIEHGKTADDMSGCIKNGNNLFSVLTKAGIKTASINSFPENLSAWWSDIGINDVQNFRENDSESGKTALSAALEWLSLNKDNDNWFLHLHLRDMHSSDRVPPKPGDRFENDLKHFIDEYDNGIRYIDELYGQVSDLLYEQGIYNDTAIIISSDHGVNMGELGLYGEYGTADQITCRIPMIFKWPSGMSGHDTGLRYNLDLLPTIAELLGSYTSENRDGKSYSEVITGKEYGSGNQISAGWDSLVLSQQLHACQRSARFGDWLYIRTINNGFYLFENEMLFNIKNDPYEQKDVKNEYPEICAHGAKIILDWLDETIRKRSATDR